MFNQEFEFVLRAGELIGKKEHRYWLDVKYAPGSESAVQPIRKCIIS
jgi:hypothetical protein